VKEVLRLSRGLPEVLYNEDPCEEPLDHVEPHNPDETEPEADFEEPESAQAELPEQAEGDTAQADEPDREDLDHVPELDQEIIEVEEAARQVPEPAPPRIDLRPRERARFHFRRWAQSIQGRRQALLEAIQEESDTA